MNAARLIAAALAALGALTLGSLDAHAQSDRGEEVAPEAAMVLSPDVAETVGPPLGPPVGPAQLDDATHELAARIRCPVCQGHSISDSPSETARNMLALVRAMVAAGYVEDQVFVYFETRYGEFIRLLPRAEGFNLLVWAIPLSALALGFLVVVLFLRKNRAATRPAAAPRHAKTPDPVDAAAAPDELDPWLEQIRRDVDRRDG
jgi:cytochrome c-type biogenesis protein CcmH/NrfF